MLTVQDDKVNKSINNQYKINDNNNNNKKHDEGQKYRFRFDLQHLHALQHTFVFW